MTSAAVAAARTRIFMNLDFWIVGRKIIPARQMEPSIPANVPIDRNLFYTQRPRLANWLAVRQRRFFAKARPDAVFKYRSNLDAWASSEKATYVLIRQGANLEV